MRVGTVTRFDRKELPARTHRPRDSVCFNAGVLQEIRKRLCSRLDSFDAEILQAKELAESHGLTLEKIKRTSAVQFKRGRFVVATYRPINHAVTIDRTKHGAESVADAIVIVARQT